MSMMNIASLARSGAVAATLLMLAACGGGESTADATGVPPQTPPPASGLSGSLAVTWSANTEPDLQGYRVYFGTASGSYAQVKGAGLDAGSATEFIIRGLQAGSTYYVAVTAYDTSGNESGYSPELVSVAK
jgi:hypothetical protein